ncbi:hypothetical protein MASR1M50_09190 [Burkholderiales bacterium]
MGKESAFPNAAVLAAWAAQGADVLYILTGERSATALSPEEQTLLAYYRDAPRRCDARRWAPWWAALCLAA